LLILFRQWLIWPRNFFEEPMIGSFKEKSSARREGNGAQQKESSTTRKSTHTL
jgi:hypothetical protein